MKAAIVCTLVIVPVFAAAAEMPGRKAGLWEITTTMHELSVTNTMKQCVDAATDARMMTMGKSVQSQGGMSCTTSAPRAQGAGYVAETTCAGNGMKMSSRSVFTGDFQSSYSGKTSTKFTPPVAGIGEQNMTMEARWVGPCEAGQKPGDIIMPGGVKMNIGSM